MNPDKTDEQLLSEFIGGHSPALGELARRYERPLLGLARGLLGGREDLACDAVQETWLRVIRFGQQFAGRCSFKTWIYRIGINQSRTLRTVQSRVESDVAEPAVLADQSEPSGQARDVGTAHRAVAHSPDQPALAAEQNHAVRRAVERLDLDKRLVILLCYHSGMTHEQAAEILEIPLGTLKSRLHAGLTELRASLSAEVST
jgi:RNA polymerase sigma-70 factor, ECF subfamily